MTNELSRRIRVSKHLGLGNTHNDGWIDFYRRSGSLIDILRLAEKVDGNFPIVVSDTVNKGGSGYVVALPENQVYVASRRTLGNALGMVDVALLIDGAVTELKSIVDVLTPVNIDIVGEGRILDGSPFPVLSNPRRNRTTYTNVEALVGNKEVRYHERSKALRDVPVYDVHLSLDHNLRVGDNSSDVSVGGVKAVLEDGNLYFGVGINVDGGSAESRLSGRELLHPIGRGDKDNIRDAVIEKLFKYLSH